MTKKQNLLTLNTAEYVFYRRKSPAEWEAYVAAKKPMWEETGTRIRTIRENLKISKKALAKAAGICVKTLTKLENGQFIRRFKTVSKSCLNALGFNAYKEFAELQEIVGDFQ